MIKAVIFGVVLFAFGPTIWAQTPAAQPSGKQEILRSQMLAKIHGIEAQLDGVLAYSILDLTSGELISDHAEEVFPTASSIKVAILAELYRQNEQAEKGKAGNARLTDIYVVNKADDVPDSAIFNGLTPGDTRLTLRDLAQMVVAVSDNSATNVLIDRVGMQNVNAMLSQLGLTQTRLQRKMMDINAAKEGRENLASPREFTSLLEAIYHNKIFGKAATDDFFKLLATGKASPMRRAFPDSVTVADKPGELDAVRNDIGIIYAPNRPFAISVMTSYLKSERAGEEAIGQVAQAAFEYFDRLGRSSPYGREMQPPLSP